MWIFILKGKNIKYYTKELLRAIKVVAVDSAIVLTVVAIKYRPAYDVSLAGKYLGVAEDRIVIEQKLDEYLKDTSDNVAYREASAMPEFEFKLISRANKAEEARIISDIEDTIISTYRYYAITIDGETKGVVNSIETANTVIDEVKSDLLEGVELNIGMVEIFTTDKNIENIDETKNVLNGVKLAKTDAYKKEQEEKRKAAEEAKRKKAAARLAQTTTPGAVTGSLNGMSISRPVSAIMISSRFGSSGSRRSGHTGLDLACNTGAPITPISAGTVTFAGYKCSYGNLIIIDHGNGVQSYYAHCNSINVGVGQSVSTGTVIGGVGSTGNSTGPHLHLEIRVNGTPINPEGYLY